MLTNRAGFTLLELLVVIAIVGVLASVILASLNSSRSQSRNASHEAQMAEYVKALDLYWLENGRYPLTNQTVCVGSGYPSGQCGHWNNPQCQPNPCYTSTAFEAALSPYLSSFPIPGYNDPSQIRQGALYVRTPSSNNNQYQLWYVLEGDVDCNAGQKTGAIGNTTICRHNQSR